MWSETAAIAACRGGQPARAHRLDRHDLARERRLHVHHAVAVHRAVDQLTRERLGRPPPVRHGLRVHVPGEDHRRPVSEGDVADGVGPVLEHGLQLDVLEPRRAHQRGEERGERPFLAEHARDAAHLLDQLDRALEVERVQHARRGCRRNVPPSTAAPSRRVRPGHEQLYGM